MTDNLSRARQAAGHVAANIECALQEKKIGSYINRELLYDVQKLAHAINLLAWEQEKAVGRGMVSGENPERGLAPSRPDETPRPTSPDVLRGLHGPVHDDISGVPS